MRTKLNTQCFLALILLSLAPAAFADTARLQVVHNAADPAASVVDVYVNDGLFLDDFAFRAATPFVDVPADVELEIGVAPGNSSGPGDIIATFPVTLAAGKKYVAMANGVLDPHRFAANPEGANIAFTLFPRDGMRERAKYPWFVDVLAFHGATDAPTVDVVARLDYWNRPAGGDELAADLALAEKYAAELGEPVVGAAELAGQSGKNGILLYDDLSYGEFSRYRSLLALPFILDVTLGNDNSTVVASYRADLRGLRGGAGLVFASGFLDPAANQGGAGFGLFVALPDGAVLPLEAIGGGETARLQVIHNAADPGAAVVDIYAGDTRLLDDFAFRAATPFIDVPAGVQVPIGVAPGNSSGPGDVIAVVPFTFEAGRTYVAIASGVLDPDEFAANPNGRGIGFNIFARDGGRENGRYSGLVDLLAFHGATDAPTVNIFGRLGWLAVPLYKNLSYGDFSSYLSVIPLNYRLEVRPAGSNAVVAAYQADLRGLGGGVAVVFASGFLDPAANQGGPAFGLYAAFPDGNVVALPPASALAAAGPESAIAAKGADDPDAAPTAAVTLAQNSPNPFNPVTQIAFTLPAEMEVTLSVYDVTGREVGRLVDQRMAAGTQSVTFDASAYASGIYYYRLTAGSFSEIRKMTLLK
jgi:hypothetical protein